MKRLAIAALLLGLTFSAQAAQAAWTASQRLTWTTGESYWPSLAVDPSGHLHVVWYDLTPGNMEIYYKKSTDGGGNWTASQRLTWMTGDSSAEDRLGFRHLHGLVECQPATRIFITRKAQTREPPGQPPKDSLGLRTPRAWL
jgi:hypothetical protein